MIVRAVIAKLKAEPGVYEKLARYNMGEGQIEPAIFSKDPAPLTCPNPVIVVTQLGGSDKEPEFSSRGEDAYLFQLNLVIWGDKLPSDVTLRNLATEVFTTLGKRGASLALEEPWSFRMMRITAPQSLKDADGFPGYQMSLVVIAATERRQQ